MNPDLNLDARAQPVDDRHESIDSESVEVRIANAREVGRRNGGSSVGSAHGQVLPVERLDDFGCQTGLELAIIYLTYLALTGLRLGWRDGPGSLR